ncbi:MAG: hypothetical protein ACTTJ3_07400 [Treponema sp.]
MNVLKSEKLKLKKSGVLLLCILTPVICGVFSAFFGGTYNATMQTIYWWMGSFLYFLLQFLAYTTLNLEKKAGNNFNVDSVNQQKSKIYMSKIFWVLFYGFIGSIFMTFIVLLFKWSMPVNPLINDRKKIIIGLAVMLLNSIWIVPLFMLFFNKVNGLLAILVNFIISLLISPFVAGSKLFFILPYTYPYKVAKYFFNIREAGDVLTRQITLIDKMELIIATFLSLGLFIVLSMILSRRNKND